MSLQLSVVYLVPEITLRIISGLNVPYVLYLPVTTASIYAFARFCVTVSEYLDDARRYDTVCLSNCFVHVAKLV